MMRRNTENVILLDPDGSRRVVGVARANDILQLRRWLMEEETQEERAGASARNKMEADPSRAAEPNRCSVPERSRRREAR